MAAHITASLCTWTQANLAARGLKTTGLRTALLARMKTYIQSKRESSLAYMATGGAFRMEEINLEESGRSVSTYAAGSSKLQ